jgi:hypothetical protein
MPGRQRVEAIGIYNSVRPEAVEFGSAQGRSEFETAGVAKLR